MTKSEMKKVMKPLVKECLKEMLLEEGLLSNLISEVLKGQQKTVVAEQKVQTKEILTSAKTQTKEKVSDMRRKLADSIGQGAYSNIFEGLEPAPGPGDISAEGGDPGMDLSILKTIPGLKGFK